jgi:hypothetical protein
MWDITGGEGHFKEARGIVTSSFAVNADGEVIDHQIARIYIQDLH